MLAISHTLQFNSRMNERAERPKPYVGVSGVVSPEQASDIQTVARASGLLDQNRRLALGVKAVHKTQFMDIENKYGQAWYPVGDFAFRTAVHDTREKSEAITVAQTYLDIEYVNNPGYREAFADRIFERGASWIDGIQFDMLPWHSDPAMLPFLETLKEKHDSLIFLQCHADAMENLGPKGAARALGRYACVDYVLFDASHGTGKRLDTDNLKRFLDAAYSEPSLSTTGIALAGGLNGLIVREELPKVVSDFPDVSWDAEGQLHPLNAHRARPLAMPLVHDYLHASQEVLR